MSKSDGVEPESGVTPKALSRVMRAALALKTAARLVVVSVQRTMADNLWILSAGVAFYAFLSIFPAIAGTLMVWGVFADPEAIRDQIQVFEGIAPAEAFNLISDQLVRIAETTDSGFTFGAIFSLLFALWSASRAARALMSTMNIAYDVEKPRGFVSSNLSAIWFTIMGIAFFLLSLIVIGAVPPVLEALRLGAVVEALIRGSRWLLLVGVFFVVTAMAYQRTPTRRGEVRRDWRRHPILPGAAIASAIWLTASFAFSFYLAEFNAYNQIFGSLGAVAALLMWFWISAYAIGIGAEFNAVLWMSRGKSKSNRD